MSYIRCLSNPEALYVWGDVDGNVYLTWLDSKGKDYWVKWPQPEFDEFFRTYKQWRKKNGDAEMGHPFCHKDAELSEVWFSDELHRPLTPEELEKEKHSFPPIIPHRLAVSLRVGEQPVLYLWKVTYRYFVDSIDYSLNWKRHSRLYDFYREARWFFKYDVMDFVKAMLLIED